MDDIFIALAGLLLCTGPFWGIALGYILAQRGWHLRSPFHRGEGETDG